MDKITVLGKKIKKGGLLSDFEPEESDYIMLSLAKKLRDVLDRDVQEQRISIDNRLKKVVVKAKDGSVHGEITHVPIDTFGEKHAEVRAVFNLTKADKTTIITAFGKQDFSVAMIS